MLTNKAAKRRLGIVFFPNDLKIDLLIFDLLSKLPNEPKNKFYNSVQSVDWGADYKSAPADVLHIIDFYMGNQWAIKYLSHETEVELGLKK